MQYPQLSEQIVLMREQCLTRYLKKKNLIVYWKGADLILHRPQLYFNVSTAFKQIVIYLLLPYLYKPWPNYISNTNYNINQNSSVQYVSTTFTTSHTIIIIPPKQCTLLCYAVRSPNCMNPTLKYELKILFWITFFYFWQFDSFIKYQSSFGLMFYLF